MTPWIALIYELDSTGQVDAALDRLFDEVDDLLVAGEFTKVDELLMELDLTRCSTTLLVGFLSITLAAKKKLFAREDFTRRVEQRLRALVPDRAQRLMQSLW